MSKISHQKFWRMKMGNFLGNGSIFHGVRKDIGNRGNLKQGGNASLPQGDERPCVANWWSRRLSSEGSWIRLLLCSPRRDFGQVLHSQLSVAFRREIPAQYPCCVGSASE